MSEASWSFPVVELPIVAAVASSPFGRVIDRDEPRVGLFHNCGARWTVPRQAHLGETAFRELRATGWVIGGFTTTGALD
jgi:hypothetical protein